MVARIEGFVTRAQANLARARSVSRNITPARGGVAGHWGGPRQPGANQNESHNRCVTTWRSWQNYHMNSHGWVDIGYTGGFCNHGFAFAGRGEGVRPAAQGAGNQTHYAVVWIGGQGQTPTRQAYDAFEWWVKTLRKAGAGSQVKVHRDFMSTTCAGPDVTRHARSIDGQRVSPTPTQSGPRLLTLESPMQRGDDVRAWQRDLNKWNQRHNIATITADGIYGPQTNRASSRFVKDEMDVDNDTPRIGPRSLEAMKNALSGKSPQQLTQEITAFLQRNPDQAARVHKYLKL